jgi:hypothetical protein
MKFVILNELKAYKDNSQNLLVRLILFIVSLLSMEIQKAFMGCYFETFCVNLGKSYA